MQPNVMRGRVRELNRERTALLEEVLAVGVTMPGSLFERWRVCGRPGCRCARGEKHGPYLCLSVFREGRPRVFPVARGKADVAKEAVAAYRQWRAGMQRLKQMDAQILDLLEQVRQAEEMAPAEVVRARP